MLTLCIITTALLGLLTLILISSAVMNYILSNYKTGHLCLFGIMCCALAIVNIWLLY